MGRGAGKSAIGPLFRWRRAGGEGGASNRGPLPPAAAVFIVRTPHASVNDADGDFAVTVNEAGACLTQVFRGKVLWRSQELEEDMSEYAITVKENYQVRLEVLNGVVTLRAGPSSDPMTPAGPGGRCGKNEKINCKLILEVAEANMRVGSGVAAALGLPPFVVARGSGPDCGRVHRTNGPDERFRPKEGRASVFTSVQPISR